MSDISVIVVSYRTPDLLRRCLEKLTEETAKRSIEILVVDNDSGDESLDVARSFPGVKAIDTGDNLGFGGGVNRGLREATGRYMMILNPDVEIHPGSLDGLADFLDEHPETGIAAPRLHNTDGSLQYSCRRKYTLATILLRRTFLGRLFPNAPALRRHLMLDYDHEIPRAVDWVAGAAMMVRREAVEDVGPMEENYFLYFEDLDWCSRMQARGWLVFYAPVAVMTHHWQRASVGLGPAARRHIRSGLRFFDRWGGFLYVLRQYRSIWSSTFLVLCDLAAFVAAFLIAYWVRQQMAFIQDRPVWPVSHYTGFLLFSLLAYVIAFVQQGLYRNVKEGDWIDVAFRILKASTLAYVILMASTFVLKLQGFSRVIVLGTWPLVVAISFTVRRVIHALTARAQRDRWNLRRIALVGNDPLLDTLGTSMYENPELGWEPVRIHRTPWVGLPMDKALSVMIKQLASERVSEVVVSPESLGVSEKDLVAASLPLRRAGFGVRLISSFVVSLPRRARIAGVQDVSWLTLERPPLRAGALSKRVLDLVGSLIFLVLGALPALVLMAGKAIRGKLWEPREVFEGRWGESLSLRRMAGEESLASYPLLFNVLRGQLSLVGPRPLRPGEPVPGGEEWHRVREQHRPGVVGPWSLVRAQTPQEEMHQELRYLEDWSPELDLKLLTRAALRRSRGGSDHGTPQPVEREPNTSEATPADSQRRPHSART